MESSTIQTAPRPAILRFPEVKRITGRCRTSIFYDMRAGTFPKSVSLGAKSVGWVDSEIYAWVEARIAASRP